MGERFTSGAIGFFEIAKYAVLGVVIVVLLAIIFGLPLFVSGESMKPNFSTGELVVIEKVSYLGSSTIKRGDVVAARFPADPKRTRLIKRVVGLPGERVAARGGLIYINGNVLVEPYDVIVGEPPYQEMEELILRENEYYLVGDNRPGSSDSRLWGPVVTQDIFGRASFVIWPLAQARYIDRIDGGYKTGAIVPRVGR